jgi:GNAT superfamily N-acetyltransferase
MQCRSLGFTTDTSILEVGGSRVERRADYWTISSPHIPTFYWGNFILLDELSADDSPHSWIDTFREEFPHALHIAIGVDDPHASLELGHSFATMGFDIFGSAVLTCRPADLAAALDSPYVTRPLVSDEDWHAVREVGVATRGPGFAEEPYRHFLDDKTRTQRRLCEEGHGAWWGTFVDDQLASCAGIFRTDGATARYQTVGTLPQFQRRGLARATVTSAGHWAAETFATENLVIVADPDYYAIDLYRQVGFEVTESQLGLQRRPTTDQE